MKDADWEYVQVGAENCVVKLDDGQTIGGIYRGVDCDLLDPAIGRVIASAPKMYRALQEIARRATSGQDTATTGSGHFGILAIAREALASTEI